MTITQRQVAFRLPSDLFDAMVLVKHRDGIPQTEQMRRALRAWLEQRDALPATPPPDVPVWRPDADPQNADWPKPRNRRKAPDAKASKKGGTR